MTVCTFLYLSSLFSQDFKEILTRVDDQQRFDNTDLSFMITLVATKPGEEDKVLQVQLYQRAKEDKVAYIILKPEISRGTGYLQIGDNLWIYDPESRKFSHSSFKENFQDTNAKNSDMKPISLAEDYSIKQAEGGKLGNYDVWILELTAVNDEVPVPVQKVWITKDNYLTLKTEEYSLSGRLTRTVFCPHYARIGKRYIADKILIVDNLNKGEKTQLTLSALSLADLPDHYFTKAFLEEVNR